ncbi:MAG: beta-galactosidase trimerization domain-containing protein, partial [Candidatus Sumerlaeota bacterium]|nr:beta-galactosidase trimerization domain-containing protein [Candidatus Sumerlaeota bacterium]
RCRAAWKKLTEKDSPPTSPADPDWGRWVSLERQRRDAQCQAMAEVAHQDPKCMYVSNHSWKITVKDPRTPPEFADMISADYGFGACQFDENRLTAMLAAGDDRIPTQIANPIKAARKDRSMQRILQEGALTMASGAAWHVSPDLSAEDIQRLRTVADYVAARKPALGRTHSLNPTAVLLSETSWRQSIDRGNEQLYDQKAGSETALGLQDAGQPVDLVNEDLLRLHADRYSAVVVADQRFLAPETMTALRAFVEKGGTLLATGGAMRGDATEESAEVASLLGLRRIEEEKSARSLTLGDATMNAAGAWKVELAGAKALARFDDEGPALTSNPVGRGAAAYLAVDRPSEAEAAATLGRVMRALGLESPVAAQGPARESHLIYSLRERPGQVVLHIIDIASRKNGKRVDPGQRSDIDDNPPLAEAEFQLALAAAPKAVSVVPPSCTMEQRWANGVLSLRLKNLATHAAVIIDTDAQPPLPRLAAGAAPSYQSPYGLFSWSDDFEREPKGKTAVSQYRVSVDKSGKTAVQIAPGVAASGTHSLQFVDDPAAEPSFLPHMNVQFPACANCVGRLSFDLMLESGATAFVNLRVENDTAKGTGPAIAFTGGGPMNVQGKGDLLAIPANQWLHVEIRYPLDGGGVYDLIIKMPDGQERAFPGLPYVDRHWRQCGWIGFGGRSEVKASYYIDNLAIEHAKG